jgi:hypothetical protein
MHVHAGRDRRWLTACSTHVLVCHGDVRYYRGHYHLLSACGAREVIHEDLKEVRMALCLAGRQLAEPLQNSLFCGELPS